MTDWLMYDAPDWVGYAILAVFCVCYLIVCAAVIAFVTLVVKALVKYVYGDEREQLAKEKHDAGDL